jgi:hypothetical protein
VLHPKIGSFELSRPPAVDPGFVTMGDMAVTLASGALAGAFADLITHPVCTVKARLMAQGASKASTAGGNGASVRTFNRPLLSHKFLCGITSMHTSSYAPNFSLA